MKVERKGEMKEILHDHNDVYILHLGEWLLCCQGCTYMYDVVVFPSSHLLFFVFCFESATAHTNHGHLMGL